MSCLAAVGASYTKSRRGPKTATAGGSVASPLGLGRHLILPGARNGQTHQEFGDGYGADFTLASYTRG